MTIKGYLGPIAVDFLGDFVPQKTADPSTFGEEIRLDMTVNKAVAEQLKELVDNRERRQTFGAYTGVLEFIWVQNRPELFGHYLFLRCDYSQSHMQSLTTRQGGWASISLDCVIVQNPLCIVRSATERVSGYDAKSLVVQPFWGETRTGEPFEIDPGGTAFSREYDPRTEYDPSALILEPELYALWDDPEVTWDDPDAVWEYTGPRLRIHSSEV